MVFHVSPSPIKMHWWACSDPADEHCAAVFALADPSKEFCTLSRDAWSWTHSRWSVISQFNLVCGSAWKSQLANAGFFMGYLIGSGVFGGVSDSRGRKPVLFGCTAFGAACTVGVGLAPNYVVYFIMRLLTGIGAAGQALTAYILATESVGPAWRGTAGVTTQCVFIFGEFVLVLIAYVARPWRVLSFTVAVVNAAQLLLWPFLPESPRWLLVRGRVEEATAVLAKIAAGNGRAMPSEPLASAAHSGDSGTAVAAAAEEGTSLMAAHAEALAAGKHDSGIATTSSASSGTTTAAAGAGSSSGGEAGHEKPLGLTAMLLSDRHMLRRFLVLAYVWMVVCMTYYGISLALSGLPGSIYVSFMIAAAAELPANLVAAWAIDRFGRHNTMAWGMLLGGAACLACAFVPAGPASSAFAALGKFGCAGAFTIASIFTSEMFPTLVRSAVLGAENEAARVGGIAAPFIVLVGVSTGQGAMPFIIFGIASLVAGAAIFTLPETLGTRLPDTMQDMGGIQSIFTTQPWRAGGWRQTLREMFRARGGPGTVNRASPHAAPAKGKTPSGFNITAAMATADGSARGGAPSNASVHAVAGGSSSGLTSAHGAGGGGNGSVEIGQVSYGGYGPVHDDDPHDGHHTTGGNGGLLHSATAYSDAHFGGASGGGGAAAGAGVMHSRSDGVHLANGRHQPATRF
ncbi:hypothetical protein CHLRE_09g387060v5 [Chlamydomonas reinhardtii]|uniref:Major facilitator superfamily (MFS) profile domain-containing protein n=1 Tax=Chlamydomonas reinhardtii TaxID=3055 RepID=A0A2K3DDT8_CHLRE|nr:uncharacterized protein CHLRE_09g387060v5 [Chlamydomonas reinhardtii]PNW78695.1 hypothetical protein CHLRE_09g387060v5 [Chlamydomonas reinhardtii]